MSLQRRRFLHGSAVLSLAPLGLLQSCSESYVPCFDPEMLDVGEKELRKSLEYVDVTSIEDQRCDGCQFYLLADAHCGECELLDGPVTKSGHCTSWTQKL